MKKQFTRIISGALSVCMLITAFTGCNEKKTDEEIKEDYVTGEAAAVDYNPQGKFTTTLMLNDGELLDSIETKDVSVYYVTFNKENDTNQKNDATVEKIEYKDGKNLEISFTDTSFNDKKPYAYTIEISQNAVKQNKTAMGAVTVTYPEQSMVSDTQIIFSNASEITAQLTLENAAFAEDVRAENLSLSDAFQDMKISSFEKTDKGLNVTLSGKLYEDVLMGVLPVGRITLARTGVAEGLKDLECEIEVRTPGGYINANGLTFADGRLSVPLTLEGCAFAQNINKQNIRLSDADGASIIDFEKISDTCGMLILSTNANDIDTAVAALQNGKIHFDDKATNYGEEMGILTCLPKADLQVIFDYVEEKDGKFLFSLELTALNGSFNSLTADQFTLGGDFAEASDIALKDNMLTFSIPAIGNLEELSLYSTVAVKAGAMKNEWGTLSDEVINTRTYTRENLGKDLIDSISEFLDSSTGQTLQTTFGVVSNIGSAVSFGVDIAEMLGWKESEMSVSQDVRKTVNEMNEKLDNLISKVNTLDEKFDYKTLETNIKGLNDKLRKLKRLQESYYNSIEGNVRSIIKKGKVPKYNEKGNVIEGKFYKIPKAAQDLLETNQGKMVIFGENGGTGKLVLSEITDEKITAAIMRSAVLKTSKEYYNKTIDGNPIDVFFTSLCDEIQSENYLHDFDSIQMMTYNWEDQAVPIMTAYRAHIDEVCILAGGMISTCVLANNPDTPVDYIIDSVKDIHNMIFDGVEKKTAEKTEGIKNSQNAWQKVKNFFTGLGKKFNQISEAYDKSFVYNYVLKRDVSRQIIMQDYNDMYYEDNKLLNNQITEEQINEMICRIPEGQTFRQNMEEGGLIFPEEYTDQQEYLCLYDPWWHQESALLPVKDCIYAHAIRTDVPKSKDGPKVEKIKIYTWKLWTVFHDGEEWSRYIPVWFLR